MKTLMSATAASAAALLLAAPSWAQPGPQPGAEPPSLEAPPAGGGRGDDRAVTLAEYQTRFRDRMMRADTDHDGRISLAEWMAARQEGGQGGDGGVGRGGGRGDPARQFQMMDANADGYLTPAEVDAVSARRFARLDANHDGVLTSDERSAMRHGGGGRDGQGGEPTRPLAPQ